jgi:hypothetical protein
LTESIVAELPKDGTLPLWVAFCDGEVDEAQKILNTTSSTALKF